MDKAQPITPSKLCELVSYDPETGAFHSKATGEPIGRYTKFRGKPYLFISIAGKDRPAGAVAWAIMTGQWPDRDIDHKDLDPSNNRWANLRKATDAQNQANRSPTARCRSGIKGVCYWGGLWQADITHQYRNFTIGRFKTKHEAAQAYADVAHAIWGEYARSHVEPSHTPCAEALTAIEKIRACPPRSAEYLAKRLQRRRDRGEIGKKRIA